MKVVESLVSCYQRKFQTNNVSQITFQSILTLTFSRGQTSINDHLHIQALLQPNIVHHLNNLQNKHILTKIISGLLITKLQTLDFSLNSIKGLQIWYMSLLSSSTFLAQLRMVSVVLLVLRTPCVSERRSKKLRTFL